MSTTDIDVDGLNLERPRLAGSLSHIAKGFRSSGFFNAVKFKRAQSSQLFLDEKE